jgi:quercetin dioxygenase-like cupin family protein
MKTDRWLTLLVVVTSAGALADGPALPSPEAALVANLASAVWKPAPKPVPEGVQVSPIAVDPETKASLAYARFPPGLKFPVHTHSHAEYTVLVSGQATFTVEGVVHELRAGSYLVIPAKVKHGVTCGAGSECILLTRRAGPTDYQFVTAP